MIDYKNRFPILSVLQQNDSTIVQKKLADFKKVQKYKFINNVNINF